MKYKLTKTTKEYLGIKLYQIQALEDFGDVEKGDLGGWIEKEDNLSQNGNAWVFDNAQVSGDALIFDNARVFGNALIFDNAWVFGDAQVFGNSRIYGNAWVFGNSQVSDNARVFGDAQVYGDAQVFDKLKLIGGYFYHYKEKSEEIERIEVNDDYELLCSEPELEEAKDKDDEVEKAIALLKEKGKIRDGKIIDCD